MVERKEEGGRESEKRRRVGRENRVEGVGSRKRKKGKYVSEEEAQENEEPAERVTRRRNRGYENNRQEERE